MNRNNITHTGNMKKIIIAITFLGLLIVSALAILKSKETDQTGQMLLKEKYSQKYQPSVDHSKFQILKGNFSNPQDVTSACISCHTERHKEVMKSNHWNWEREEYVAGRGIIYLGKKNAINNFCIGVEGNEKSCAKCHVGFGMTKANMSFTDSTNIDCLVCHDQTESYTKGNELGGAPAKNIDLNNIAQHVGKPKRSNCGVCHFFGGGGNNVKHGDLDKAMFDPQKELDAHMGTDGVNLQCVDCHKTNKHTIAGKMYSLSSMNRNRANCEDCHTEMPHDDAILNNHTYKVACQTCHIPTYAKANSTKLTWDWSTAGHLKDGKPFEEDDSLGNHTYLSIKGTFTWGRNLTPDYAWFNGTAKHYLLGDKITDSTKPLDINTLNGSYSDQESKIIPVKVHVARQPYDPVNMLLIQPKLYADKKGEGALWKDFDWDKANLLGMQEVNLPYSGKYSFLKTVMYWPINHQVSTKDKSVACLECHTRDNGRLNKLRDFYMPGRDFNPLVETAGMGLIILVLIGVIAHGSIRIYSRNKNGNRG